MGLKHITQPLSLRRSDLHLSKLKRVVCAVPCFPAQTISVWSGAVLLVLSAQVAFRTSVVPPSSMTKDCATRVLKDVIVDVIGGERPPVVPHQTVVWKKRKKNEWADYSKVSNVKN